MKTHTKSGQAWRGYDCARRRLATCEHPCRRAAEAAKSKRQPQMHLFLSAHYEPHRSRTGYQGEEKKGVVSY